MLLPRLAPGSFPKMSNSRIDHLLFVAISRATKWVYMSTTRDAGFAPLDRFQSPGPIDYLTIQRGNSARRFEPATEQTGPDDLLDLL